MLLTELLRGWTNRSGTELDHSKTMLETDLMGSPLCHQWTEHSMLRFVPLPDAGQWGYWCQAGIESCNHPSSWKPGALPPATLISRTSAPPQAYFSTCLISELNPKMCACEGKSLGSRPWPQLQRELGRRFSWSLPWDKHEKTAQSGWQPEDLTGVAADALMLVVEVFVF